jgi:tRNA(Ile)-lysidine synthetase-like protein
VKRSPHRFRLVTAVRAAVADLPPGGPVVVACSGGPDSLALAAAAADVGLPATAAIVDHRLQPQSGVVAADAAAACRSLGLVAHVLDVSAASGDGGPEARARAARYAALDRFAADIGAAAVLLGHTRDDQAETVLLGLLRGSGTRSLAGMPPRRGRYRRPFLDTPRAVVAAALAEYGAVAWEDPHNTDPRFTRARVRHVVLPLLADQLGPGVAAGLVKTAELAREDCDALDRIAAGELRRIEAGGMRVDRLAPLDDAIRRRVLRAWLLTVGCPADDLTREHVLDVDRLIGRWHGQGPLHVPGGVRVARDCGRLVARQPTRHAED